MMAKVISVSSAETVSFYSGLNQLQLFAYITCVFQIIYEWFYIRELMGHKCDLTASDNTNITSGLGILEISQIIGRHLETVKEFTAAPMKLHQRAYNGPWEFLRTKREAVNNPGRTNGEIFKHTIELIMSRTLRYVLKNVGISARPVTSPPLAKILIQKRLK